MKKDKIAFDLDGCLIDTLPWLCKYMKDTCGLNLAGEGKPTFDFDLPEGFVLGGRITDAIIQHQHKMLPFKGGHAGLSAISKFFKEDPLFITARNKKTEAVTRAWLDDWLNIPYKLMMVKSHSDKEELMEKLGLTMYVEDRYRTICQIAPHLTKVFCIKHSYNQGRPLPDNVVVVDDMWGVFEHLCRALRPMIRKKMDAPGMY